MPSFFSRLKGKDGPSKVNKKKGALQENVDVAPPKPRWEDAWTRKTVDPEEVQELLRGCTLELKSRGMEALASCLPAIDYAASHWAFIVELHKLICSQLQALIPLFSSSPFDQRQIPARRVLLFGISLIAVHYMGKGWHKNYG
jgi:hypothetical protein